MYRQVDWYIFGVGLLMTKATFPPINMVLISDPSCRYPSFLDALGDLDDCLSMCFLFGTMPQGARVHMEYINHARKLTGKMWPVLR